MDADEIYLIIHLFIREKTEKFDYKPTLMKQVCEEHLLVSCTMS